MLYWYFVSLSDQELGRLMYKTDVKFWQWVECHYNNPTPESAYQVERWRRISYMIFDELHQPDRIVIRNA